MSNQPPYGYDPQQGGGYSSEPAPLYPQQGGAYPQQPGAYPPPPPQQPGMYPPQDPYSQQPGMYPPPSQPLGMYGQPVGVPYGVPVPQPDQGGGMAIAGLILGILSIPLAIFTFCDLPFIVLGLVFSILGRRSVSRRGLATAGLICTIIGLVIAIILFGVGLARLNTVSTTSY